MLVSNRKVHSLNLPVMLRKAISMAVVNRKVICERYNSLVGAGTYEHTSQESWS